MGIGMIALQSNRFRERDEQMTTARIIPNINGDTICVCDVCGHALEGYTPDQAGVDEYSRSCLEGCLEILTKTDGKLHDEERSDSNLIPKCDVCLTPKSPFQWYSIYAALPADAYAFTKGN